MHASSVPALDVAALRRDEFPHMVEVTYLNAASIAPLPTRSLRAVSRMNERRARVHELTGDDFEGTLRRARRAAAALIGAEPEEIALVGNTSHGINLAAQALPISPGSTILGIAGEFPANVYPWTSPACPGRLELVPVDARGFPDEARLLERLRDPTVSVLAISAVQFVTGYRADLAALGRACRDNGVHFVVDGIQAAGQVPLDVREGEIDVLAVGGQKWLCAPAGTGFVYVRRGLIEAMQPRLVGWNALEASADLTHVTAYGDRFLPDARRFEVATLPFHDIAGFAASLDLLGEVGVATIERHLRRILAPIRAWATEAGVELASPGDGPHASGILSLRTANPARAVRRLAAEGVICGAREGCVRLAPHLYNDEQELLRVASLLPRVVEA